MKLYSCIYILGNISQELIIFVGLFQSVCYKAEVIKKHFKRNGVTVCLPVYLCSFVATQNVDHSLYVGVDSPAVHPHDWLHAGQSLFCAFLRQGLWSCTCGRWNDSPERLIPDEESLLSRRADGICSCCCRAHGSWIECPCLRRSSTGLFPGWTCAFLQLYIPLEQVSISYWVCGMQWQSFPGWSQHLLQFKTEPMKWFNEINKRHIK